MATTINRISSERPDMVKRGVGSKMGLLSITCLLLFLIIISIYPTSFVSSALRSTAEQHSQLSPLSTNLPSLNNTANSATNNTLFPTFQNSNALGMTIKHPINWNTALAGNKALILLPPSDEDNSSESLVMALFGISTNINVSQLSDQAIKNYGAHYNDFYILNLKPISFQGKPAYLLLYTYTNPKAGKILTMDIGIKDRSKFIFCGATRISFLHIYR